MDIVSDLLTQITVSVKDYRSAIGGAFVSFLVAQDFNLGRFVAGFASGIFCAAYFTEWLLFYMPVPADINPEDARAIAGALWGLTGYVVVSTIIIFAQQKTAEYLTKSADNPKSNEGL